jgi:hypothetical protein
MKKKVKGIGNKEDGEEKKRNKVTVAAAVSISAAANVQKTATLQNRVSFC